jgi:hypothetical protein
VHLGSYAVSAVSNSSSQVYLTHHFGSICSGGEGFSLFPPVSAFSMGCRASLESADRLDDTSQVDINTLAIGQEGNEVRRQMKCRWAVVNPSCVGCTSRDRSPRVVDRCGFISRRWSTQPMEHALQPGDGGSRPRTII